MTEQLTAGAPPDSPDRGLRLSWSYAARSPVALPPAAPPPATSSAPAPPALASAVGPGAAATWPGALPHGPAPRQPPEHSSEAESSSGSEDSSCSGSTGTGSGAANGAALEAHAQEGEEGDSCEDADEDSDSEDGVRLGRRAALQGLRTSAARFPSADADAALAPAPPAAARASLTAEQAAPPPPTAYHGTQGAAALPAGSEPLGGAGAARKPVRRSLFADNGELHATEPGPAHPREAAGQRRGSGIDWGDRRPPAAADEPAWALAAVHGPEPDINPAQSPDPSGGGFKLAWTPLLRAGRSAGRVLAPAALGTAGPIAIGFATPPRAAQRMRSSVRLQPESSVLVAAGDAAAAAAMSAAGAAAGLLAVGAAALPAAAGQAGGPTALAGGRAASPGHSPSARLLVLKRQQARPPSCAPAGPHAPPCSGRLLVAPLSALPDAPLHRASQAALRAQETRRAVSASAAVRRPPPGEATTPDALAVGHVGAASHAGGRAAALLEGSALGASGSAAGWLGALSPARPTLLSCAEVLCDEAAAGACWTCRRGAVGLRRSAHTCTPCRGASTLQCHAHGQPLSPQSVSYQNTDRISASAPQAAAYGAASGPAAGQASAFAPAPLALPWHQRGGAAEQAHESCAGGLSWSDRPGEGPAAVMAAGVQAWSPGGVLQGRDGAAGGLPQGSPGPSAAQLRHPWPGARVMSGLGERGASAPGERSAWPPGRDAAAAPPGPDEIPAPLHAPGRAGGAAGGEGAGAGPSSDGEDARAGPFADPAAAAAGALAALCAANAAAHRELDWRAQNGALAAARRLLRHHAQGGGFQAAPLLAAAVPAVDALRSQTARAAMLLLQARAAAL